MGRHHARILSETPGVTLVAACDADGARAEEHAALRSCAAVTDPADLPADVDVAVIATPTSSHRDVAVPLLRRGVSCLVEKPIAASLADADAMLAAAEEGGAVLSIGHAERCNPGILRVRDRIARPLFVECHRLGAFPGRSLDVDVVLDLMIHDLDLLLWLTGGEVEDVRAVGVSVLTPRVDIANARLELSTGCTANLTASRVSAEMTRKLRVFQEDAYISVDLPSQSAEIVRVERGGERPEIVREKLDAPAAENRPEPLRIELEAFLAEVRASRGETAPAAPAAIASGLEGRRALSAALRVLEAMERQASRRGP